MITLCKLASPTGERFAIVVESLRAWEIQPKGQLRETPERTLVWVSEQPHPFVIAGNHDEALTKACAAVAKSWNSGGTHGGQ